MDYSPGLTLAAILSLTACSGSSSSSGAPGAGSTFQSVVVYSADDGGGQIQAWRAPVDGLDRRNLTESMPTAEVVAGGMSLAPNGDMVMVTTEDAGLVQVHAIDARTGSADELALQSPALPGHAPNFHWNPIDSAGGYLLQHQVDTQGNPNRAAQDLYLATTAQAPLQRVNQDGLEMRFDGWALQGDRFTVRATEMASGQQSLDIYDDQGLYLSDPLAGETYSEGLVQWTSGYMGFSLEVTRFGVTRTELYQHALSNQATSIISPFGNQVDSFSYSPSGSLLAMELNSTITGKRLVALTQSDPNFLQSLLWQQAPLAEVELYGWSDAHDLLALSYVVQSGAEGEVLLSSTSNANQSVLVQNALPGSRIGTALWSPDGNSLAFTSDHEVLGRDQLYVYRVGDPVHHTAWQIPGMVGSVDDVVWSPDSNYIFASFEPDGAAFKSVAIFGNDALHQGRLVGDRLLNMAPQSTPDNPMPNLQPAVDSSGVIWVQQDGTTGLRGVVYSHVLDAARDRVLSSSDGTLNLHRIFQFFVR
ncbi:MAG: hypothetical protein P1V35_13025 [Planctomycetota bacterium]|nr:hypothetical protein [Planctomycetota bacterium]